MNSYPSTQKEWSRRTERMTPILWVLVTLGVVAFVVACYAWGCIV